MNTTTLPVRQDLEIRPLTAVLGAEVLGLDLKQVAFSRRFGPLQIHVLHPFGLAGRQALFVSEHFTTRIVGLPDDESRALLGELFAHATQARFVDRHRWPPQHMVFRDNRSVLHLAAGCPPEQCRKLYRTTIEGDVPA